MIKVDACMDRGRGEVVVLHVVDNIRKSEVTRVQYHRKVKSYVSPSTIYQKSFLYLMH